MKFHPILFSTPMVQAIGDGTKTQTRRTKGLEEVNKNSNQWTFSGFENDRGLHAFFRVKNSGTGIYALCPYEVGDILYVREMFSQKDGRIIYRANVCSKNDLPDGYKWKPSIHMPKKSARYFLKIKSIKVERLQQINESDAKAEGAKDTLKYNDFKFFEGLKGWNIPRPFSPHQFGFLFIWCKINGAENWLKNPFVWVYEFEKIEKPDNFI